MSEIRVPPVGTLTVRVQLQRRTMVGEDEGGHLVLWTPIATVWSRVRTVSSRQTRYADGRSATMSHTVVMRFRTDIGPGDRVLYRGRALEVIAAEDINGRRAYVSCACTETAMVG